MATTEFDLKDKTTYTVKEGDTLTNIAVRTGKGYKYYQTLAAINGIENADLIRVGQVLKLTSDGSSTTDSTTSSSKAVISQFGLQSNSNNTLFAVWKWSRSKTDKYQVKWEYYAGGVWFVGSSTSISVNEHDPSASRQSTYDIPTNATVVRFRVKPIAKSTTKNSKITYEWTADWSATKTYRVKADPPEIPDVPTVSIVGNKITATLERVAEGIESVQFKIIKNNTDTYKTMYATAQYPVKNASGYASASTLVAYGNTYKVCCRIRDPKTSLFSDWSEYSPSVGTPPSAPDEIKELKALSETSVYIEWTPVSNATGYTVEYTTDKTYFDSASGVQSSFVESVVHHAEILGLETGTEQFFRVRATNDEPDGESDWTEIKSIKIGTTPTAPTTWSSTTTAMVGEPLNLYWMHNTEDGSSQTFAEVELTINGATNVYTIKNSTEEDEKDSTSVYEIDTSKYKEGVQILWRVRTAGITNTYGPWSIQRTVSIYAPPTAQLSILTMDNIWIDFLTSFPFKIRVLAGPNTQAPISYHITITANESYIATDNLGNEKMVSENEAVYSRHFDVDTNPFELVISANDVNLEDEISYTVTSVVAMNSGLTSETSIEFKVSWSEKIYEPNAEIGIDEDTLTAQIRPYCENRVMHRTEVTKEGFNYYLTAHRIGAVYKTGVVNGVTVNASPLYRGVTADGTEVYYIEGETISSVENVSLSVYRREFDGTFTEIATGIDSSKGTYITDPHPSLDYARYRIVATDLATGAVSYSDIPGYPIGETAAIIQWDEEWKSFDVSNEDALSEPEWTGQVLKLPYNIDVSNDHKSDVDLIEYIGREHPVSYYGTQRGETATWNMVISKDDVDTLYMLRRLAIWQGDVYVREPSGSGYWANVRVGYGRKHRDLTIPITLSITRVEGGM